MRTERQLELLLSIRECTRTLSRFSFAVPSQNLLLTVLWNWHSKISGLEIESAAPGLANEAALSTESPPDLVRKHIESLTSYLADGAPLPELDWDDIDQSEWTEFQKQVYRAIASIPHGETRTYGWVANRIGAVTATRAVGQALRNNPLPILIPCHRVVAASSLGGFMGADDPGCRELGIKKTLIGLEERYLSPVFSFGERYALESFA